LPLAGVAVVAAIAAVANMIVKAGMAWLIGGGAMGRRVAAGYLAALMTGAVVGIGVVL